MDALVAACLFPIAVFLLISGLDDLVLDLACLWHHFTRGNSEVEPSEIDLRQLPEKRLAIFVPLWHEHRVIAGMLEHNIAAIDYRNYDFFIGAYPNDELTLDAVREMEDRFPNVHLAVCPHDGPTSKADCLNWVYQLMLLYEEQHGVRFDVVLTHDAEDLIHPGAFLRINWYAGDFGMIQIPVLPLPTPARELVHGIYIDEFAEYQTKDIPARQILRSFLPSNGVGTGFTREALETLAVTESNRIFEPSCLTEDYENGMRIHRLGFAQKFVPIDARASSIVATREYFPRGARAAIRQRTRWVTGISLQSWERHGWRAPLPDLYWFWRDRKGLLGNPLSLLTNLLFFYGLLTWALARLTHAPWGLAHHSLHPALLQTTLFLQSIHLSVRIWSVGRLYGWPFAALAPIRAVLANGLNCAATLGAIWRFSKARWNHEPLVWLKTEHAYPTRGTLVGHKRKLGEILVGSQYIDELALAAALATQPPELRIGEHLIQLGLIDETDLYEALSLQQSLPAAPVLAADIPTGVARSLPRHVVREWQVLPFRVSAGSLHIASPEIPTDAMSQALRECTSLNIRFQLITPDNFRSLQTSLNL